MHALIVDDSRAMRKIIGKIMRRQGFELLEAENGAVGLDMLKQHHEQIDVLFVDWNMPVMNGLDLVIAIRAESCFDQKKIVMVTTETEPTRMARAMMSGVDEFVMKPFTEAILIEKLQWIGINISPSVETA